VTYTSFRNPKNPWAMTMGSLGFDMYNTEEIILFIGKKP